MSAFQAFVCDGTTGDVLDRVKVSAFTWERLLSARGSGQVTIPLDGTYTRDQVKNLTMPWSRIFALAHNDVVQFMGYVTGGGYTLGGHVTAGVSDLWSLLARRGAWNHNAGNVEKWKTTVSGSLSHHAAQAILRGRTGPALPSLDMPVTLPGQSGTAVSRTYYGYHLETVTEVLDKLLAEGLDIYFRPRFIPADGEMDWLYLGGPSWGSGVTHELYVTTPVSAVSRFAESTDASRVTNNARFVGEGAEQDMLIRSNRNPASPYPLLDRTTSAKTTSNAAQLAAMANADLALYGQPTVQWDFSVHISQGVDVGDTVRLHFDGDPWIADGWHSRRVVKVSGSMSEFVTVSVQPTGGA